MANTTVSIRAKVKIEGRWRWSCSLRAPEGNLTPSEAERQGKFYLVWTEGGQEARAEGQGEFRGWAKVARAKARHLEDAADAFERKARTIRLIQFETWAFVECSGRPIGGKS